jgi:ubiquinone/menaquinone biosynthesis C-methylase UbiE
VRDAPLTHAESRALFDRFGSRQDWQAFYEDAAVERLLVAGRFELASAVVEFGSGTGRLAERLLRALLPPHAAYVAFDSSTTMVTLARSRLCVFGDRASVALTDGTPQLPLPADCCDRFLATYVIDLLSRRDARDLIVEARRVLVTGGLLCLVSLTSGQGAISRAVEMLWMGIHRRQPQLLGGCRPVQLLEHIGPQWHLRHYEDVRRFGVCSEVVVAEAA